MYRVGARECGFAILVRVSRVVRVLVHVLVRESVRYVYWFTCTGSRTSTIRSFARKVLFKVHAHLPLVRESEV